MLKPLRLNNYAPEVLNIRMINKERFNLRALNIRKAIRNLSKHHR